jgi:prophage regulatory protein
MDMQETKVVRFKELQKIIPVSRTTIFRWEKQSSFPKHFPIGKNSVAWLLSDVEAWLKEKSKEGKK